MRRINGEYKVPCFSSCYHINWKNCNDLMIPKLGTAYYMVNMMFHMLYLHSFTYIYFVPLLFRPEV